MSVDDLYDRGVRIRTHGRETLPQAWSRPSEAQLTSHAPSLIAIEGERLTAYLHDVCGFIDTANVGVDLHLRSPEACPLVVVAADAAELDEVYRRREESLLEILPLPETVRRAAPGWIPRMRPLDRLWNLSLCAAASEWIGAPNYAWPCDEQEFYHHALSNFRVAMLGRPSQLERHKNYLRNSGDCAFLEERLALVRGARDDMTPAGRS